MQHQFTSGAYIWAAFVVLAAALMIYLTTRRKRERKKAQSTASGSLSEGVGPDHPWFGLWSHLFKWRDFSENELQQIVGHCDYILQATAHKDAVLEWESTMMKLVGEDSPATAAKAIDKICREGEDYFRASQEWAKLSQKHFNTMVLAEADKCIASMFEQQAKHTQVVEALRKDRDYWKELAKMFEKSENAALQDRDDARSLALDLRAYLDRALAVINEQHEQIRKLTPVEASKHSVRGKDGRFVKAKQPEAVEFKKGDWVRGVAISDGSEVEGEVVYTASKDFIHVKRKGRRPITLFRYTCRHVPRPTEQTAVEVMPTEAERPDDSHVGEQAQPADLPPVIDWSKPQPFPEGYIVRKGDVVFVEQFKDVAAGTKAKVVSWYGNLAVVEYDVFKVQVLSHRLAPLDPRQHPEHPEFKPANTDAE